MGWGEVLCFIDSAGHTLVDKFGFWQGTVPQGCHRVSLFGSLSLVDGQYCNKRDRHDAFFR